MQRAGLAGPCSLGVGALAQWEPGVCPWPVPFLSPNSSAPVRLWTGVFCCKKNYKSDKIKVIFIWEVKSELPARSWALGPHHFCCSLGGAGNLCGVNRGAAPTITTVKHLYLMLSKPSLTSSQPG